MSGTPNPNDKSVNLEWEPIYRRFAARLTKVVQSRIGAELNQYLEAEEVVDSAFRTLIRRESEGISSLASADDIWKFLLVVTLNKLRQSGRHYRTQKRSLGRVCRVDDLNSAAFVDLQEIEILVLEMTCHDLVERLPSNNQLIIGRYLAGDSPNDIAIAVSRSRRTVSRAIESFQALLEQVANE